MANLFSKAKKTAESKTSKKEDKKVKVMVKDPDFFEKVQKLEALQERMKIDKAKADMISDELRDLGKESYVELYQKMGRNPGTITLVQESDGDTASMMFVPSDKYITVSKERADELVDLYGEDVIEEETTFSFDMAMIEKYGEVLSMLIDSCPDIDENDKEKIIKATTKFSVAKGSIDKMDKYGDVGEVMESIKPVVALKNVEIIKG